MTRRDQPAQPKIKPASAAAAPGPAPDDDWPRVPSKHGRRAKSGQAGSGRPAKPALEVFTTTLWEYPSQHYLSAKGIPEQGDRDYAGATPSWIIWQLLQRYTREKDLVVDPMCGSGTTLDVARDLDRRALGYDLSPPRDREDVFRADARKLPLEDGVADFVFIDPPYSTHVKYSDDPHCIGTLDAGGEDGGRSYYQAMEKVIAEIHRILKPQRYLAMYVSDSWRKTKGGSGTDRAGSGGAGGKSGARGGEASGAGGGSQFMPIGFELFSIMRKRFKPVDIIAVVRHNAKLTKGNWHKAAKEGNYFLRGFNYLFVMKKEKKS